MLYEMKMASAQRVAVEEKRSCYAKHMMLLTKIGVENARDSLWYLTLSTRKRTIQPSLTSSGYGNIPTISSFFLEPQYVPPTPNP
mmetsp:Transcript_373/g.733  ORF Transcript_373/g.733 Transcript_373/m.733 type:complete len:85 (-) Transcript_373:53-307(-)